MEFQQDVSLKDYNTFGLDVKAENLCLFTSLEELKEAIEYSRGAPRLVLGGGSNVLMTKDQTGLVMVNRIPGIIVNEDNGDQVLLRVGSGVVWHDLVMRCVENELGGVENLSLIPGSVGAAPMQNIGAYGVEILDVFYSLEAYHVPTGEIHVFENDDCKFGYRESIFKRELKGEYIILYVNLVLSRNTTLNTSYGAIENELERLGKEASIASVSEAVINIRRSKLPDPAQVGNAGSFFKNPVIKKQLFDELSSVHPEMPNYPAGEDRKLAAGWLIEQCGWKGKDLGGYGVHDRQALVLVNHGGGSGEKLFKLSEEIIESVVEKFGVTLEREVNVI